MRIPAAANPPISPSATQSQVLAAAAPTALRADTNQRLTVTTVAQPGWFRRMLGKITARVKELWNGKPRPIYTDIPLTSASRIDAKNVVRLTRYEPALSALIVKSAIDPDQGSPNVVRLEQISSPVRLASNSTSPIGLKIKASDFTLTPDTAAIVSAGIIKNTTKAPRWDFSVYYSGHMTTTYDAGGDNKFLAASARYAVNPKLEAFFEAHMNLLTPEVGTRNLTGQTVNGQKSNQRDTGEAYVRTGVTVHYEAPNLMGKFADNHWTVAASGGVINGLALKWNDNFYRWEHKRIEGNALFRTSSASSPERALAGVSVYDTHEILGGSLPVKYLGPLQWGIKADGCAMVGTDEVSAAAGLLFSLGIDGQGPQPGLCKGLPSGDHSGISAGVYGQIVGSRASTNDVGTRHLQSFATVSYKQKLLWGFSAESGIDYPFGPTVVGGKRPTPNYYARVGFSLKW